MTREAASIEIHPIDFKGTCLCGAVSFRGTGLRDIVLCHCGQCRRQHGAAASYTATQKSDLVLSAQTKLAWFRSSPRARRGFCRDCGTSLFWEPISAAHICINASAIEQSAVLRIVRHIYFDGHCRYDPTTPHAARYAASMND